MSERTSIVLTSILKPVNDTRMFEKFGLSLGQTNKYDVNIIGFASKNIKKVYNVNFYPIFNLKRTSPLRLLAPWKVFFLLFKVKPSLIIFNTVEIQYVILLYKLLTGCKIIYDVQENYFRNIYYNKNYILPVRILLAYSIRLLEWSGRWLVDKIILAEEGYKFEMPRSAKKAIVIKNTYKELDLEKSDAEKLTDNNLYVKKLAMEDIPLEKGGNRNNQQGITFLFSGTISDNYGVFTAIDFIETVQNQNPFVELLIAGYCANEKVLKKLLLRLKGKPYIKLIGGDHLVPHQEIINYIRQSDFGLICYEINPSTENCFPTKIYEYMANQLPILIQNYKPWSSFCLRYNAGIEVNYKSLNVDKLLESINSGNFYNKGIPDEVFWKNDERKLLKLVEDIQS